MRVKLVLEVETDAAVEALTRPSAYLIEVLSKGDVAFCQVIAVEATPLPGPKEAQKRCRSRKARAAK